MPFADLLEQLVRTDTRTGAFREGMEISGPSRLGADLFQQTSRGVVSLQQGFNLLTQRLVVTAGLIQVGGPLLGGQFDGDLEDT
jgi:hypothetical protein